MFVCLLAVVFSPLQAHVALFAGTIFCVVRALLKAYPARASKQANQSFVAPALTLLWRSSGTVVNISSLHPPLTHKALLDVGTEGLRATLRGLLDNMLTLRGQVRKFSDTVRHCQVCVCSG